MFACTINNLVIWFFIKKTLIIQKNFHHLLFFELLSIQEMIAALSVVEN